MRKFDTINVIPFIDIMLVLLAIVLTTATFISNGQLEIKLPNAVSKSPQSDIVKVEIAIDKEQNFFLDGDVVSDKDLPIQLGLLDKATPIVLRIDESVPFERFITVIDQLKILELDKVSILTKKIARSE